MKGFLTALVLLAAINAAGKPKLSGSYTCRYMGGLCSTVITFVNDSIYKSNSGCEGPGHTHFGKYTIKSDSLFLNAGLKNLRVKVLKIDSFYSNLNLFQLKFIDQKGRNMTQKFEAFFTRKNKMEYSLEYDSVQKALTYRNISNEDIKISTLEILGVENNLVKTDFPRGLTLIYHLEIPEIISQLDLFNKDINASYCSQLFIRENQLIQMATEKYGESDDNGRIFEKEN